MKELPIVNSNLIAVIDDKHFDRLSKLKWYITKASEKRFSIARQKLLTTRIVTPTGFVLSRKDNVRVTLANEVMQEYQNLYDHINRNPADNQEHNLRIATYQQNAFNRKKLEDCVSQYKGVSWKTANKKWQVALKFSQKTIYIGLFKDELEAALAYNKKAMEIQKEFVVLNDVSKGYTSL